ncbi:RTA1 like protein-domain-containing protein [Fusarium solani]|uniref:RTA1 like protein-domain-containing protein n=1 Tax=Fusarium solani TaxID=169388 RepID=A0A9P9JWP1_FUSSL|nr:RTA1 like protein-domain-containing protein [Fusarium solani]KAH7240417.1 RTA1 like protein-domain-containing protein [Fusarium solani]
MTTTTAKSMQLTQQQADVLKKGCHDLIAGYDTSYGYVPTFGAGIAFCVLFLLSTFAHVFQFARARRWTSLTFALGAMTELIGWAGRTWSSKCPYNGDAFLMQITTLIIAPTFFTAGLYVILGTLITRLGRSSSLLGPKMYAIVFLTADIVALVIQAIGGALASTEADKINGDTETGTNIMVAGIVFQMAAMVVFTGLVLDFMRRVFIKKTYLSYGKAGLEPPNSLPVTYAWLLVAVCVSLGMIFIRSIYRTVELAQGWEGYLITHEGYFIGLDACLMIIAVGIFNFLDPVFLLPDNDIREGVFAGEHEMSDLTYE